MPYICERPQRIMATDYAIGDMVPADVVNGLKQGVVNNMLTRGVIRYVEDVGPQEPTYKGGGWWVWPNGLKARGPADAPPVLTGAS